MVQEPGAGNFLWEIKFEEEKFGAKKLILEILRQKRKIRRQNN
jgi:hypothetical protein